MGEAKRPANLPKLDNVMVEPFKIFRSWNIHH